jgi:uncharacterized membrane protein
MRRFVVRVALLAVLAGVTVGIVRADIPATAFRRDVVVGVPRDAAWRHFNRAKAWPSWATYIASVELTPDGELGPTTAGRINLRSGQSTTFRMTEFVPGEHWQWSSEMLWLTLDDDHAFEAAGPSETRIVMHMRVRGFGKTLAAPLIDRMSRADLDAALPRLAREMNERAAGPSSR